MLPVLLTIDVFGTIVDWRSGLRADLAACGRPLGDEQFEEIINTQAVMQSGAFRTYRDITAASLVQILGLDLTRADAIGRNVGRWPLFSDARAALRRLLQLVPCVAMTNSDLEHGERVQE